MPNETKFNLNGRKKILILHTSIGMGHKFIAQNIGYQLSEAGCDVKVGDILEVQKGRLSEISTKIHQWMNIKIPWMWSFLYHFTNNKFICDITLSIKLWLASRNCQKTLKLIQEFQPDLVISVHNVASAVISHLKKKQIYKGLFAIGFSDFHLHQFWLYPNADFYLANIEEQKEKMIKLGIEEKNIFVCGITLKPKLEFNGLEIRKRLGIKEGEKVILIGSGSLGTGFHEDLISELENEPNIRPVVACGKNQELVEKLKQKFPSGKVVVLGFYTPMQELYFISDLFLSKPGGLSTSESLQYNLPMFLTHYLPGQEELNVNYLLEKGLVMYEKTNIIANVKKELFSGTFKKSLQNNPNRSLIISPKNTAKDAVFFMLHNV